MRTMLVIAALLAAPGVAAQQAPPGPVPDSGDPRATLFVRRGCAECHAIAALKIKAKTDVGPDLTFAYADVRTRYGMALDRFLDEPPGVMRLVLGVHIQLARAEADSLVQLFRHLYDQHVARVDSTKRQAVPYRGRSRSAELDR